MFHGKTVKGQTLGDDTGDILSGLPGGKVQDQK
jgi:hypothetical protein